MIYFSFRFSCLTFEKLRQTDMQLALRGPSPGVQEIPRPFRFPPLKITLTECVVLLGREDESKRNHLGAPSPSSPHSVGRGGPVLTLEDPPSLAWKLGWGAQQFLPAWCTEVQSQCPSHSRCVGGLP